MDVCGRAVMDPAQNTSSGIGGSNGTVRYQTNDGTATVSAAASASAGYSKENLNQVINSIQKTLGLLHQLHLTVSSFTPASQLHLLQRLNSLVIELDNMAKLSEKCNIQVPMEVLSLIDDGKNPDEFTRDVLNSCIARNQVTKGKTDAFKDLRKHILEELEQTFPDEVDKYREIRATSAASLRENNSANKNGLFPLYKILSASFHYFSSFPRTSSSSSEPEVNTIDVSQAHKLLHYGYTFLDVRTVEEFEKGHVDSEKVFNVPYWFYTPLGQENNPNFLKLVSSLCNQTDHLVVGCKSGVRSLYATKDLVSSGYNTVKNMDGGYIAWIEKRFPIKVEQKELKNDEL